MDRQQFQSRLAAMHSSLEAEIADELNANRSSIIATVGMAILANLAWKVIVKVVVWAVKPIVRRAFRRAILMPVGELISFFEEFAESEGATLKR